MESKILPGQLCIQCTTLIKNNAKVKSYTYGEFNYDGLHILIRPTFIQAHRGLSLVQCLYPTSTHSNDKLVLARAPSSIYNGAQWVT